MATSRDCAISRRGGVEPCLHAVQALTSTTCTRGPTKGVANGPIGSRFFDPNTVDGAASSSRSPWTVTAVRVRPLVCALSRHPCELNAAQRDEVLFCAVDEHGVTGWSHVGCRRGRLRNRLVSAWLDKPRVRRVSGRNGGALVEGL